MQIIYRKSFSAKTMREAHTRPKNMIRQILNMVPMRSPERDPFSKTMAHYGCARVIIEKCSQLKHRFGKKYQKQRAICETHDQ